MNSTMSGWSTFKITILAARRVLPPLLITPAKASKPFMKLTGPEAMPPPERASRLPRSEERSEEHTSELQSRSDLVCRLLLEKKKTARDASTLLQDGTNRGYSESIRALAQLISWTNCCVCSYSKRGGRKDNSRPRLCRMQQFT